MDMGIDNHLRFTEDEAGTRKMFEHENRARMRFCECVAMECAMPSGSYFDEK